MPPARRPIPAPTKSTSNVSLTTTATTILSALAHVRIPHEHEKNHRRQTAPTHSYSQK